MSADKIPVLKPILDRVDNDGRRCLQPVAVRLGPQATEILITDAASGIGYLFSIVNPPTGITITWSGYFMPMLVLFSRCLYLAFVANDGQHALSGVPIMANVMYLADHVPHGKLPRPFIFGATISAAPQSAARDKVFQNHRGLTTTWRRDELLLPTLSKLGKSLPLSDELLVGPLVKQLHLMIIGNPQMNDPGDPEYPLIAGLDTMASSTLQKILVRKSLKKSSAVHAKGLLKDIRTRATLIGLLRQVVELRYAQDYDTENKSVISACQRLLHFYVVPHIFEVDPVQPQNVHEVALIQKEDTEITNLVNSLWKLCRERFLIKVYQLKVRQELYEVPPAEVVYGRCAETYPVVCIQ